MLQCSLFLRRFSRLTIALFVLLLVCTSSGVLQAQDQGQSGKPTMVNIQVDLEKEGDQTSVYNILNEVQNRGWNATVYVTGEFATNHPEVVKDIHDRGHQIAVHGWEDGENLRILDYETQVDLLSEAFTAVRTAVGEMSPAYISDFRPQGFHQNNNTFEVLQALEVRSNSGFIAGKGPSHPYNTGYGFVAIPISSFYQGCGCPSDTGRGILLSDHYVLEILGKAPSEYFDILKQKYDQNNLSKEPMVIIVHASIIGADDLKLQAFAQFLDYVGNNNGQVVLTDLILTMANPYIVSMSASGPASVLPGESVPVDVTYTPTCYCPDYYLKIYGTYSDNIDWHELDAWSYFHRSYDMDEPYTWYRMVTLPNRDGTYILRVVGRACHSAYNCWPTPYSYEAIATVWIHIGDLRVDPETKIIQDGEPGGKYMVSGDKGATGWAWSFTVGPNTGKDHLDNDPHCDFSPTDADPTNATTKWYPVPPAKECRRPSRYSPTNFLIHCNVAIGGETIEAQPGRLIVARPPLKAGETFWPTITGAPLILPCLFDGEIGWCVEGRWTLRRTDPRKEVYVLEGTQFHTKVDLHETVHFNQWATGIASTIFSVDEYFPRIENLAAPTRRELRDLITNSFTRYMAEERAEATAQLCARERDAFWHSDQIMPYYFYQGCALLPGYNCLPAIGEASPLEERIARSDLIIIGTILNERHLFKEPFEVDSQFFVPLETEGSIYTAEVIQVLFDGASVDLVTIFQKDLFHPVLYQVDSTYLLFLKEIEIDSSLISQHNLPQTTYYEAVFGEEGALDLSKPENIQYAESTEAFLANPSEEFFWGYSDAGVDTDGDGHYDLLSINVGTYILTSGEYVLDAWLHDTAGNEVMEATSEAHLEPGWNTLTLNFDGYAIQQKGLDGPYVLQYLILWDESRENELAFLSEAYTTSAYAATDFALQPSPDVGLLGGDVMMFPEKPRIGDLALTLAAIHNYGNIGLRNVKVQFFADEAVAGETIIDTIPANFTEQVGFNWLASEGTHNLKVKVDPDNQIAETNEDNNEYAWQMAIGIPDFTVGGISIAGEKLFAGDSTWITVTIDNLASESETRYVDVAFYLNDNLVETRTIDLYYEWEAPLYTWTAPFEILVPDQPDTAEIRVVLDPDNEIQELDEGNNESTEMVEIAEIPTTFQWETEYGQLAPSGFWYRIPLGFDFPFFDATYSEVFINWNGFLTFEEPDWCFYGDHYWNWGMYDFWCSLPRIAPLWTGWWTWWGVVHYNTLDSPERFIVSWLNFDHELQGGRNSFQVVLFEDGLIQFGWRYLDFDEVDDYSQRALTGVTDGHRNIASLGEGMDFNEGTLDYQNRWFVWNGYGYDIFEYLTGSISGIVSDSSVGLLGVTVDLFDSEDSLIAVTYTDNAGSYDFDSVVVGDYTVSIVTPLGFIPDAESKPVTVTPDADSVVDFHLTRLEIIPSQRSMGYWKHQVNVHLYGRGQAQESLADMSTYMSLVGEHFNKNLVNPITIFEVPQPASLTDSLEVLQSLLTVDGDAVMKDRTKQQLIALMLNVVSEKLDQMTSISENGTTVSQAITYCNELICSENSSDDETAKDIADNINNGITVPAGVIPLSTPNIAYKGTDQEVAGSLCLPESFSLFQNYPNPFNPVTQISYTLLTDGHVKLEIYNLLGQKVAIVVDEYQQAGQKTINWEAKDLSSGIYFYKLTADDFTATKKMVLTK